VIRYFTQNSIYEVDEANRLVRRVVGKNDPTPHQGPDEVWKSYQSLQVEPGGILIIWGINDGVLETTVTSPVTGHEEVDDEPKAISGAVARDG
jgi:hypothetical protein